MNPAPGVRCCKNKRIVPATLLSPFDGGKDTGSASHRGSRLRAFSCVRRTVKGQSFYGGHFCSAQYFYTRQGGGYEARPTIESTLLDGYEIPKEADDPSDPFLIENAGWGGVVDDEGRTLDEEWAQRFVQALMADVPELRGRYTEPHLAEVARGCGLTAAGVVSTTIQQSVTPTGQSLNISDRRRVLKLHANELIKDIVQRIEPYTKGNADAYGRCRRDTWIEVKTRAGLDRKYQSLELQHITDEQDLERLIEVAKLKLKEVSGERRIHHTSGTA